MWLNTLEIDGFGCLETRSIEFGRGMTVVSGLNESGKSTLHAAVLATLFGFFDRPDLRGQRAQESLRQRFVPWNGKTYGVTGVVERDHGPALRLVWEYDDRTRVRVYDALTGAELSGDFRGRFEGALDTQALWGVSRDFYVHACFVRQGELRALEDDGAITRTVEAVASSGGRDESAQRALTVLNAALGDDIGSDRSRIKPLPVARSRVAELEGKLSDAETRRNEFSDLAVAAAEAADHAQNLDRELGSAEAALDGTKLTTLNERVDGVNRLAGRIEELDQCIGDLRERAGSDLPDEAQLLPLDAARREATHAIRLLEQEIAAGADGTGALARRTREREEEVGLLAPFATGPDAPALQELTAAVAHLEGDVREPESVAVPDLPTGLLDLERQVAAEADELERLRRQHSSPASPRRARVWLLAAAGCVAGAVVALALGAWPAAVLFVLLAGGAAAAGALPRGTGQVAGDAQRIATLETRGREASERRAAYERAVAMAEGQRAERESRLSATRAEREEAGRTVDRLLGDAGYAEDDRKGAIAAFQLAAEKRVRHAEQSAGLERLRQELKDAQRPERERADREADVRGISQRLLELYEGCSIQNADLDTARQRYDDRLEAHKRLASVRTERERAAAELSGLLGGKTPEEVVRERDVLAARGVEARSDVAEPEDNLTARVHELREYRRAAEQHARELKGQLEQALQDLPEPARLREGLVRERQRVEDLEEARAVLELARETLDEAAEESYRDIAPRLNAALGASLSRITGGRYTRAFVDNDYTVRVESDEMRDLVEPELLSHGTREQIYLVQRLELIDILSGHEPLPVLLDDPLSHSDPRRREALAALLADRSQQRQLMVLSTDPRVADVLSSACEECTVVSMDE